MKERRFKPALPPGKNKHGRRDIPTSLLGEYEAAAVEAAQEIAPLIEEMIRERLRHVTESIPEGEQQEVILTEKPNPPFFGVTTKKA